MQRLIHSAQDTTEYGLFHFEGILEDFLMARKLTYEEQGQRAEEVTTEIIKRDPKEWVKINQETPLSFGKL